MDGRLAKSYLALVVGRVPAAGELATPVFVGGRWQPALARYRGLAAAGPRSLVELDLVTGRQHQARQQLAAAGWPIVGDRRYRGPAWPGLAHPFLHCHRLGFPSLADGQPRQVNCPLPAELAAVLAAAGFPAVTAPAGAPENYPATSTQRV
jgi:23S rRNA-/tRNA-specific pseudouridylate synthase